MNIFLQQDFGTKITDSGHVAVVRINLGRGHSLVSMATEHLSAQKRLGDRQNHRSLRMVNRLTCGQHVLQRKGHTQKRRGAPDDPSPYSRAQRLDLSALATGPYAGCAG